MGQFVVYKHHHNQVDTSTSFMFLDTTSKPDSTLSSSALPNPNPQPPPPPASSNTVTESSSSSCTNEPSNRRHKQAREAELESPSSHNHHHHHHRKQQKHQLQQTSIECRAKFVQNILFESLWRIKSWLSASVGAFWAALSFINHFIESRLIRGLLLIPAAQSGFPPADNNNTNNDSNNTHRQLAWQGTPMISYRPDYHSGPEQEQSSDISHSSFVSEIEPEYLSVVNRARKWSEEAALVLRDLKRHEEEHNNNNNSISSINLSHIHCIDMDEHRGRIAQRAGSENNHTPSSVRLLSAALPLHGIACSPSSSLYTDALQIHRHAGAGAPFELCPSGTNIAFADKEVRRGRGPCVGDGGGSSGAQQQKHKTPTDFQGQLQAACCSLEACSQSTRPLSREEEDHYYHHEQQQQQKHRPHNKATHHNKQQEQQQEHQTPLEQTRLGLSRALFGMHKTSSSSRKNSSISSGTSEQYSGSCLSAAVQHNQSASETSRSSGASSNRLQEEECNRLQERTNNAAGGARSSSPLVLVSKSTLNDLTEQIAFSMNKMKDLEEKVRVIPELERRLHNVISDTDSRSSSIGIRDSKYVADNYSNMTRSSNNNNYYPRRGSLNDSHNVLPYNKTMFSSSLRQPYGGSMRYTPGCIRGSQLVQHHQQQQSATSDSLARASSFSLSSPYTNGQRYFDKLVRGGSNMHNYNSSGNNEHGNSRQSLDHLSNALRSTQDSLNSGSNALSTKVEYEELINDLISLSYSVNCNSSNTSNHSAHSRQSSSSGGGGGDGIGTGNSTGTGASSSNHGSQVKGTHGNTGRKLELHDVIHTTTSKTKQQHRQSNNNIHQHSSNRNVFSSTSNQPSNNNNNNNNTYHLLSNHNQNHHHSNFNSSMSHLGYSHQHAPARDNNNHHGNFSHIARNNHNGSGSLSLQTTPVKTQLDCGCQSFKEHLRYNSISREQRLNGAAKSQQVISSNTSSNNASPLPPATQKADASTNTDLSMEDVVTKSELTKLVEEFRKSTHNSNISPPVSLSLDKGSINSRNNDITRDISTSPTSETSSSGSATGPNSSSQPESRSTSSGDDRLGGEDEDDEGVSDDNVGMKSNSSASAKDLSEEYDIKGELSQEDEEPNENVDINGNEEEEEEDDDDEIEVNINSLDGAEEAYSLGSSYQDPSDFEEYCAYGESLDRRTKDFLSQTTKIPNDLRFALIRLNDSIKKDKPFSQIESTSNCIDVIRKEWFEVAASKDAQAIKTRLYVDFFESFTKQLLNTVVNLTDTAGNTAMHYAASHFKLDIIDVLLDTKVCDVNCRNKAGYTPIMLLALTDLDNLYDQEVARHLFSMGDVNIKARSSGQTALMLAASHGRVSTCKLLLECGADPSLQDYDGSTALMCGSELGNEDVVRCLLAHKLTDPGATDNDGLDALTIAMNNGHKNIGLILYAAKNVPRMTRSATQQPRLNNSASCYLGASLRRSRGRTVTNHVKRADSLLGSRHARHSARQFEINNV